MLRPPTVGRLNEEAHEMEHSAYQFQWIGSGVFSQELGDIPILHPRRNHSTSLITNHDPDQLQYVRVGQTLPGYDLPAEVLQMVRVDHDEENRSGQLTFFIFLICRSSSDL